MRRLGVVVALLLALTACSGGDDAGPQITADPDPLPTKVSDPRITPLKSKNPTAQKVYAIAANFALRYQFDPAYLRLSADRLTPDDFKQFESALTRSAYRVLRDAAERAPSDTSALDTVRALTFVSFSDVLKDSDFTLRDDQKLVEKQKITEPRYEFVSGSPTIFLLSSGQVLANEQLTPTTIAYGVRMRVDFEEVRGEWRIQSWKATWAFRGEQPAPIK